MKTVRVKVYQFSELSDRSKEIAILNEIERFRRYFNESNQPINQASKNAALDRLLKYRVEFKADGTRF